MNGYLKLMRPNKEASDIYFKITIIDKDTLNLGYWNNKTDECLYRHNFTKEQLLFDDFSDTKISDPHRYIAVATRQGFKKPSIIDVFRYTHYNKAKTGGYIIDQFNLTYPLMYFVVPYIDSPWEDWSFISSGKKIYIDNVEHLNVVDTNKKQSVLDDILKLLPSIKLSADGNEIDIQLLNPNGSDAHKEDIEVYLETTTGVLQENRVVTNKHGRAQTKLHLSGKGKVKAGFKFYPGKVEIQID